MKFKIFIVNRLGHYIHIFHCKLDGRISKNFPLEKKFFFENLSKYEKNFSEIQVFDRCQKKSVQFGITGRLLKLFFLKVNY
jgi:hypothetical protein